MKKISLVVFPALTIVLEALPLGAVCTFAPSPTERVRETFSYFSLIPFGYANFASLITAILTVVILLLSLISLKKDSVFNALVCSFDYYSNYFSYAVDVWIKQLLPCRSFYNDSPCNRKHFC